MSSCEGDLTSESDPGSSSHGTGELKGTLHHSAGKERNVPCCLCGLGIWKSFLGKKKNYFIIFRPEKWPSSARRCRWHPGHGGGQCWVSLLCCAEPPWPWYFCLVLCTLKLSSDFWGRTWTRESDNMVSLENAVAFLLVLSFPGLPKAMQAAHRYLLVLKWS